MLVLSLITRLNILVAAVILASLIQVNIASAGNVVEIMTKIDMAMDNVRASVEIIDSQWSKGNVSIVHVKIENVSNKMIQINVISSFIIFNKDNIYDTNNEKEGRYWWCPINLKTLSARTKDDIPDLLSIDSGKTITFEIYVATLHCELAIRSLWPFEDIFSVVPPGQYNIHLELDIENGNVYKEIISQDALVTIIQ